MNIYFKCIIFKTGLIASNASIAQESCKVLMPSISNHYEGECKKDKAHGSGKAEGTDQYVGDFKQGLPDGKGIYRWANGNFYDGDWAKGKRVGQGGMAYKRNGKADSVVTGFWENDVYLRKFDKPFKVYSRTLQVTKSEVKFKTSPSAEITILLSNTTGNMPTMSGQVTPKATITEIVILGGSYLRLINLYERNRETGYKLEKVVFPFRAKLRFANQEVDVEFIESGEFTMNVVLNN